MASNPYVNKVEYAGQTLMDLTSDTATPSDVLNGVTFHDRSGTPQTGSLITHNVYDGLDSTSATDALSANQGKVLNDKIPSLAVTSASLTNVSTGVTLRNVSIKKSGRVVTGYVEVSAPASGGSIGKISASSVYPSAKVYFSMWNTTDNKYVGYADIGSDGIVTLHPISGLTGSLYYSFALAYTITT